MPFAAIRLIWADEPIRMFPWLACSVALPRQATSLTPSSCGNLLLLRPVRRNRLRPVAISASPAQRREQRSTQHPSGATCRPATRGRPCTRRRA
jgi:hypothetical protein